MQINGTGALVSGGASGLGEATARELAAKGAVVTIFDRDESKAKTVADELGAGTSHISGDVGDPEAVSRAVEQAAASTGLRINVNCAGVGWAQRTIDRQGEPHDF